MEKMRRFSANLVILALLAPLLVGCAGAPSPLQEFIGGLLGRPAPTQVAPPEQQLLPTPTLAAGSQPGAPDEPQTGVTPPAPAETAVPSEFGPFTGTFEGVMFGDNDSSAPLELQLVQRGAAIEGAAMLGEGLVVRAGGVCGSFPIPAITINAADELDHAGERTLSTTTSVNVSGFDIPVELQASLDPDGDTVTASATIYPPALCGANPTVTATLTRVAN